MGGHPGRLRLCRDPDRSPRARVLEARDGSDRPTRPWWRTSSPSSPSRSMPSGSRPGPNCSCGWPSPTPAPSSGSPCSGWATTSSRHQNPARWPPPSRGTPNPRISRPASSIGWPRRRETIRLSLSAFLRRPREPIGDGELSAISCPVLVVLGERDMTRTADRLLAALPSASFVSVPGVDHFATLSDFGVIDATMKFFGLG